MLPNKRRLWGTKPSKGEPLSLLVMPKRTVEPMRLFPTCRAFVFLLGEAEESQSLLDEALVADVCPLYMWSTGTSRSRKRMMVLPNCSILSARGHIT